jgi:hypothetical protein
MPLRCACAAWYVLQLPAHAAGNACRAMRRVAARADVPQSERSEAKQSKAKQSEAKRSEAKRNEAKRSRSKQIEAKAKRLVAGCAETFASREKLMLSLLPSVFGYFWSLL